MSMQEVILHWERHTWTSLNSLACRRSAAFTGSMWRSAATEMDIPSTSVTGSCALACSMHACMPPAPASQPIKASALATVHRDRQAAAP